MAIAVFSPAIASGRSDVTERRGGGWKTCPVPRRTWLDIKIDVFLEELAATVSAETEEMT